MQSNNYIVIQGWMCNELGLKGNELLIFAMIHGFSQDGVSKYYGGRKYIADTFNISLPTVDKALQGLLDKEYIIKHISGDYINPDSYWVNLEVVKKLYEGSKETLHGGSKETLLNKDSKQTDRKKEKNSSKEELHSQEFSFGKQSTPKKANLYTKCVQLIDSYDFSSWGNIRKLLIDYLNFRLSVKDKPLYINMWKGMLNKLANLCVDDIPKYEEVIKYCIERGYLSFYEPTNYSSQKNKPWEKGVDSSGYTEAEKRQIENEWDALEAEGLQTWY